MEGSGGLFDLFLWFQKTRRWRQPRIVCWKQHKVLKVSVAPLQSSFPLAEMSGVVPQVAFCEIYTNRVSQFLLLVFCRFVFVNILLHEAVYLKKKEKEKNVPEVKQHACMK